MKTRLDTSAGYECLVVSKTLPKSACIWNDMACLQVMQTRLGARFVRTGKLTVMICILYSLMLIASLSRNHANFSAVLLTADESR